MEHMRHLDPERLAALGDSEPTADEMAHLADCVLCERERLAYRELLSLSAAERSVPLSTPLSDWSSLSASLAGEGLLRPVDGAGVLAPVRAGRGRVKLAGIGASSHPRRRVWLQAAAAVLLAGGGAAVGRATAGLPSEPSIAAAETAAAEPTVTEPSATERRAGLEVTGGPLAGNLGRAGASFAAGVPDSARAILSIDDALALMRQAESEYRLAAAYIAASDTSALDDRGGVDQYRTRLAALDRVSEAALAAVNEAPADPVVNQYLISTRAARDVTLQQLNSSLPAGMSLTSY
jgi:hypothetical protein